MNVLIVENGLRDLYSSRKPLGQFLEKKGHSIVYACPNENGDTIVRDIPMSRNSISLRRLIRGVYLLLKTEREHNIDAVITFRLIPNVLNAMASFFGKERSRFGVITGLGVAFVKTEDKRRFRLKRKMIEGFYFFAQNHIQLVAQNPDDLLELGVKNGKVIFGSGVSAQKRTTMEATPVSGLRLLFVGRLLKSKGILEAVKIFRELKMQCVDVRLTIAGDIDDTNPDSLSEEEFQALTETRDIECLGYVRDIDSVYASCNVLLFLSKYREGVPRAIIEALKYGLTIVTYDLPGCRETISENGLLLADDGATSEAVSFLANLSLEDKKTHALNSEGLFNRKFCSDVVYPEYLELISKDNSSLN